MDRVEGRMLGLEQRMDKGDDEFEAKVIRIIENQRSSQSRPQLGTDPMIAAAFANDPGALGLGRSVPQGRTDRQEQQFYEHRRSLRLWPVEGADPVAGFGVFLWEKLKLDEEFCSSIGNVAVRQYRDPRSKAKNEVIALFENSEVADAIRGSSSNLAGMGFRAGIRLHVPGHLMTNFKLLENLGYQMRAVDSNVRRVIKFDDQNLDMMMDVKMGDRWRRVRPPEAKAANTFSSSNGPEEMSSGNIADFFANVSRAPGASNATGANATQMGP